MNEKRMRKSPVLLLSGVVMYRGLAFAADVNPDFAPLPPLKHPIAVIAHRAGRGIMPENTLTAIRNAIRLGVDYVELDIRATKDGHLVIMHDGTVDRTTNGTGAVKDLDFAAIRSARCRTEVRCEICGRESANVRRGIGIVSRQNAHLRRPQGSAHRADADSHQEAAHGA